MTPSSAIIKTDQALSLATNSSINKHHQRVVDIGINLTHRAFQKNWRDVVRNAVETGVDRILLTGTCMKRSQEGLKLAQTWWEETGCPNLFATVGIHPHDAKTFDDQTTIEEMKQLLQNPLVVSVGECGLDYNRTFSSREQQINAFREQIKLAIQVRKPLFVHEREAHEDLIEVFDEFSPYELPPIVIHCFTGTAKEALEYIRRGYYIGFTGTICKQKRGAPLREFLTNIPPKRIMVETDAPFMGFKKDRRNSEPADCADVARKLGETVGVSYEDICQITTKNAIEFFRLDGIQLPVSPDRHFASSQE